MLGILAQGLPGVHIPAEGNAGAEELAQHGVRASVAALLSRAVWGWCAAMHTAVREILLKSKMCKWILYKT